MANAWTSRATQGTAVAILSALLVGLFTPVRTTDGTASPSTARPVAPRATAPRSGAGGTTGTGPAARVAPSSALTGMVDGLTRPRTGACATAALGQLPAPTTCAVAVPHAARGSHTITATDGSSATRARVAIPRTVAAQLPALPVGPLEPFYSSYDPTSGVLFTSDGPNPSGQDFNGVTAISRTNAAYTFPVCLQQIGDVPKNSAYNPANDRLYVACAFSGIAVVNPHTDAVETRIALPATGDQAFSVLYDPANNDIYVGTEGGTFDLYVINPATNTISASFHTKGDSLWLVYSPANKEVYADNTFSNNVTVINGVTNAFITYLPLGIYPYDDATNALYDPASQDVYFACGACQTTGPPITGFIFAVNPSDTVVATIALGFQANFGDPTIAASDLVYNSANHNLYVGAIQTGSTNSYIYEISSATNRILGRVRIPGDCEGGGCLFFASVTFDPVNASLYVSGPADTVSIVSSTLQVMQVAPVAPSGACSGGFNLLASTFDPANSIVYVFCSQYGTIIPFTSSA